MRFGTGVLALMALLNVTACSKKKPADNEPAWAGQVIQRGDQTVIITPEMGLAGKVVSVNAGARFVVLTFPIGQMPALERRLNVYRRGLKVGEVKITGPQRDDNTVADVLAGEAQAGDEVRDK
jgi:hypothetical protein